MEKKKEREDNNKDENFDAKEKSHADDNDQPFCETAENSESKVILPVDEKGKQDTEPSSNDAE